MQQEKVEVIHSEKPVDLKAVDSQSGDSQQEESEINHDSVEHSGTSTPMSDESQNTSKDSTDSTDSSDSAQNDPVSLIVPEEEESHSESTQENYYLTCVFLPIRCLGPYLTYVFLPIRGLGPYVAKVAIVSHFNFELAGLGTSAVVFIAAGLNEKIVKRWSCPRQGEGHPSDNAPHDLLHDVPKLVFWGIAVGGFLLILPYQLMKRYSQLSADMVKTIIHYLVSGGAQVIFLQEMAEILEIPHHPLVRVLQASMAVPFVVDISRYVLNKLYNKNYKSGTIYDYQQQHAGSTVWVPAFLSADFIFGTIKATGVFNSGIASLMNFFVDCFLKENPAAEPQAILGVSFGLAAIFSFVSLGSSQAQKSFSFILMMVTSLALETTPFATTVQCLDPDLLPPDGVCKFGGVAIIALGLLFFSSLAAYGAYQRLNHEANEDAQVEEVLDRSIQSEQDDGWNIVDKMQSAGSTLLNCARSGMTLFGYIGDIIEAINPSESLTDDERYLGEGTSFDTTRQPNYGT